MIATLDGSYVMEPSARMITAAPKLLVVVAGTTVTDHLVNRRQYR